MSTQQVSIGKIPRAKSYLATKLHVCLPISHSSCFYISHILFQSSPSNPIAPFFSLSHLFRTAYTHTHTHTHKETTSAAARGTSDEKSSKLKITYTDVDGLLSNMPEIKHYSHIHKPDVFCMVETKLKEKIHIDFQQEGYKIWRRDRKGKGGGVLIMEQEDIFVEGVQYSDGMAEVIGITT